MIKANFILLMMGFLFIISCGDNPTNPENEIETVKIGKQIWMKKNLDVVLYRNGDSIRYAGHVADWDDAMSKKQGAWCYYEGNSQFGKVYGKLYNWYAVNDPRGLAPAGFHVASANEWQEMIDTLGGATIAGGKLKEAGAINWNFPNTGADNSSGFSALPGGNRSTNTGYYGIKNSGYWWTSTPANDDFEAKNYELFFDKVTIVYKINSMGHAFSVRCIKD